MPAIGADILKLEQGSLERASYMVRRWFRTPAIRGTLGSLAVLACVWGFVSWLSLGEVSEGIRESAGHLHQIAIENTQVELGLGGVEGLDRVSRAEVERVLGLPRPGSVLELSTLEIQDTVEALPWVAGTEVRISLPDRIHLRIVEEVPVALWWTGRHWWFVNESGVGFASAEQGAPSFGLPRVVGEGAGSAVAEVRAMLSQHSRLFDGQSIFERVGERRWNVRLPSGILLMLPEQEPLLALDWLHDSQFLERFSGLDVASLDLRNGGRVPVRFHAVIDGGARVPTRPAGNDSL